MVGSKSNGDMFDNVSQLDLYPRGYTHDLQQVEAHPGDTIDQVKAASSNSLNYKPNVVLINAGTNDCHLNVDIPNAGNRMQSLIEKLVGAEGMNSTLIVLSTLLPSGNKAIQRNTPAVNDQYRSLVPEMRCKGLNIVLAEMNSPRGSWIRYPEDYTVDGQVDDTHPNDNGYAKMAMAWFMAVQKAALQNIIHPP